MKRLFQAIRCFLAGDCASPPSGVTTVETTRRLLREIDAEWEPVHKKIAQEARERPGLAEALRAARQELDRSTTGGEVPR